MNMNSSVPRPEFVDVENKRFFEDMINRGLVLKMRDVVVTHVQSKTAGSGGVSIIPKAAAT